MVPSRLSASDALFIRRAAVALAALLPFAVAPAIGPSFTQREFSAAAGLTAVLGVLTFFARSGRARVALQWLVPLAYFAVVALLRENTGGAASGYTSLALLPIIWIGAYGTRAQFTTAVAALWSMLTVPILVIGSPAYPQTEWRRALVYLVLAPTIGLTLRYLVGDARARAAEASERAAVLEERKAQLSEARDLFRGVLDAATDYSIIGTDGSGVITVFNEGAERMLGYAPEDVIGRHTLELFHDPQQIAERAAELGVPAGLEVLVGAARRGRGETRDWTYVRKSGTRIFVSLTMSAMRNAAGEATGFIGIAADVTDRRIFEVERERLFALEQEAHKTVAEQNQRLRELDRMKGEFVSTVSHELRTPLGSLVAYAEMLIDGDAGELAPSQQKMVEAIVRNSGRLAALIENLLTLSRIESGKFGVNLVPTELRPLVDGAVETILPIAAPKGIEVRRELLDDDGTVLADGPQLERVLLNLLSNAVKFTPENGRVTVGARRLGDELTITVADTGVGIPLDQQPQLFQRFFRAATANEQAIPGSGLGLVIAKSIVDNHGGAIAVESAPGAGTTVTVTLPLVSSTRELAAVAMTAAASEYTIEKER